MQYNQPYGNPDVTAPYVNGDPSIGLQGSAVPAAAIEYPQREIVNCETIAGLTPDNTNLQQLWQAMQVNPWLTQVAHDTGSPNNLVASIDPAPTSLFFGMCVRIKVAFDCSGASQLDLNLLGNFPIVRATGAATQAGDYFAGEVLVLEFDGANWQIQNYVGPPGITGTTNNFTLSIPFAVSGGTANALTASFSPVILSLTAGNPFLVAATLKNLAGGVTLKANALSPAPIIWADGAPLVRGDIRPGSILFLIYDGANFQLISVVGQPYIKGFDVFASALNVPESTFTRVSPSTANIHNTLDASIYSNGVFTVGDGEAGWWVFGFDAAFTPFSWSPLGTGAAWVVRITGPSADYQQNNVQFTGNQGNSAAVSAVIHLNVGDQVFFDFFHLEGQGATNVNVHGARIGPST